MIRKIIPTLLLFAISACLMGQQLQPFELFRDNMIIQRNKPIEVYGTAMPNQPVTVAFKGVKATNVASANGQWSVTLPPFEAGGPFTLTITSGKETVAIKNVLLGDIWIASGQSNMEYQMSAGVLNHEEEIKKANYPNIRYFKIAKTPSKQPKASIPKADWLICTPETVGQFSAVGYYFAQEIQRKTGIPIGIIDATWGGSSIEAWMSSDLLKHLPHQPGPVIDEAALMGRSLEQLNEESNQSIQTILDVTANSFEGLKQGVHTLNYDDSNWNSLRLPEFGKVENQVFWMRKTIELSEVPTDSLEFSLGLAGSMFRLYINGIEVFETNGLPIKTKLAPALFKKGKNILAFRLANRWWYPHISGSDASLYLKNAKGSLNIPLSGNWKYNNTIEARLPKTYLMQNIPSALYNGMLSPLFRTAITGAIWYQGEGNGDNGLEYQTLLPAMINEWRIQFKQGYFPFLIVQLANWGDPTELPESKGWPYLREAQDKTLYLPLTGLATAIDVGDRYDIHPKDKKTVGYRLALNALNLQYNKSEVCSGPRFASVEFKEKKAIVHFDYANGLTTNDGQAPKSFALAGSDGVFYKATANIVNQSIELTCPEVSKPVAVRYAWARNPIVNLYNANGLPALPFRTDNWPEKK